MATHTFPGTLRLGSKGPAVTSLQRRLNTAYKNHLAVDGEFGPATERVVVAFQAHRGLLPDGEVGPVTWARLWGQQAPVEPKPKTLREAAFRVACAMVGVMEVGGNNCGPAVSRIIAENGGDGPEPWCGDFVAYCYRHAGSKAVTRSWAAVRLLGRLVGVKATTAPQRGDLVRYTFDHVGMFVRDLGDSIETIEGNTGPSGAVSDSSTGGDGVYRKIRSKSLVSDYLRVSR